MAESPTAAAQPADAPLVEGGTANVYTMAGRLLTTALLTMTVEELLTALEMQTSVPRNCQGLLFGDKSLVPADGGRGLRLYTLGVCPGDSLQWLTQLAKKVTHVADLAPQDDVEMYHAIRSGYRPPLMHLVEFKRRGLERTAEKVVELWGEEVLAGQEQGWSCLLWAAHKKLPGVMSWLLERRADPNQVSEVSSKSPLELTDDHSDEECFRVLLEGRADPCQVNAETGEFPLLIAAECPFNARFQMLLDARADATQVNARTGATPLLAAAAATSDVGVRTLLAANAAPDSSNTLTSEFPLNVAARKGRLPCVRALMEWRADPCRTHPRDGTFPLLHAAGSNRNDGCLRALLEGRADACQVNAETGNSPLLQAAGNGRDECLRFLLGLRADPCEVNEKDGHFPLFIAAANWDDSCVRALLEARAELEQRHGTEGITATRRAAQRSRECLRTLRNAGGSLS